MKKPIKLEQYMVGGFLHEGLVTPGEVADISRRYGCEWLAARRAERSQGLSADKLGELDAAIRAERQQLIRCGVLALARPRMTETDSLGRPLLTADEFIAHGLAESDGAVKDPIVDKARVYTPLTGGIHRREVDHSLAPFISRMTDAGYHTATSCSGLLADHPGYRYVSDSESGLYRKGEPICYNKQGSSAYVAFFKEPDLTRHSWDSDMPGCTPEQIEDIRRVAEETGWVVEEGQTFFRDSISLYMPVTLDGTGMRELLHEGSGLANSRYPGLQESDFLQWIDKRNALMPEVYEKHGGVVLFTDAMIKGYWVALTSRLVLAAAQRQEATRERLADAEKPQLIRVDEEVHRPQLEAILRREGYRLDDKALDGVLPREGTSLVKDFTLQVDTDGRHVHRAQLSALENPDASIRQLSFIAARQMLSDVRVESRQDDQGAYVTCKLDGVQQPEKKLNNGAVTAYEAGHITDEQLAVAFFAKEAVRMSARQESMVYGSGRIVTDGVQKRFIGDKSTAEEGVFFKDLDAFDEKKGICYISSQAFRQTDTRLTGMTHQDAKGYGWTWMGLALEVTQAGIRAEQAPRAAEIVFNALKGQDAVTWIHDNVQSIQQQLDAESQEQDRIISEQLQKDDAVAIDTGSWLNRLAPVQYEAEDVHSIRLDKERDVQLEQEHKERLSRFYDEVIKPMFNDYHDATGKAMDKAAQQAGFSSFDENPDRNGLRDYTTQPRRQTPKIKEQLALFDKIYHATVSPLHQKLYKPIQELQDRFEKSEKQRYLRAVMAETRQPVDAKQLKKEVADIAGILTDAGYQGIKVVPSRGADGLGTPLPPQLQVSVPAHLVEAVAETAHKSGFVAMQRDDAGGLKTLNIQLPYTMDGSTWSRIHETARSVHQNMPKADAVRLTRDNVLDKVIEKHGGTVLFSTDMVLDRYHRLQDGLVDLKPRRAYMIDDVTLSRPWAEQKDRDAINIHCTINGVQTIRTRLTPEDAKAVQDTLRSSPQWDALMGRLAEKYFRHDLDLAVGLSRSSGFKR